MHVISSPRGLTPTNLIEKTGRPSQIRSLREEPDILDPFWQTRLHEEGDITFEGDVISIDAVYACVNVLAQSIATIPLNLYRRTRRFGGDFENRLQYDHPLNDIVSFQPNDELTDFEWRMLTMMEVLIKGNSLHQILFDKNWNVLGLYPLCWESVQLKRSPSGRLVYVYTPETGEPLAFDQNEVFHLRGLSPNGIEGLGVLDTQAKMMSAVRDANEHSRKFTRNAQSPGGVVEVEEELSSKAYSRLRKAWSDRTRRGETMILEEGAKWKPTAIDPEKSQLLETRKFNRSLVAAYFRVPAHMINDLEKATFSNIEQQDIQFGKHTLSPWATNWEKRLRMALLTKKQVRAGYHFSHDMTDLLRGDFKTQMEGYQKGVQSGIWTPNQVLAKLGENPYDGGDVHYMNSATLPVDQLEKETDGSELL